jgi:hypothetical protein
VSNAYFIRIAGRFVFVRAGRAFPQLHNDDVCPARISTYWTDMLLPLTPVRTFFPTDESAGLPKPNETGRNPSGAILTGFNGTSIWTELVSGTRIGFPHPLQFPLERRFHGLSTHFA